VLHCTYTVGRAYWVPKVFGSLRELDAKTAFSQLFSQCYSFYANRIKIGRDVLTRSENFVRIFFLRVG
jgi:hypothetical protein